MTRNHENHTPIHDARSELPVAMYTRLVLGLLTVVLVCLFASHCLAPIDPDESVPPKDFLKKSVFARPFGGAAFIVPVRTDGKEVLAMCAHDYADFVDPVSAKVLRTILFKEVLAAPHFIDIDGDGVTEIAGYGDYPFPNAVVLLDASGSVIWKQPRPGVPGPGLAVGDLDRDGKPEIYFSGSRTLERLDFDGKTLWAKQRKEGSYKGIGVYDVPDAGDPFLLVLTNTSMALAYDHKGNLLGPATRLKAGRRFGIVRWPVGDNGPRLVTWVNRGVVVTDMDGRIEFEHKFLEGTRDCLSLQTTLVRFKQDEPPLLAVMVKFANYTNRSMLCMFSLAGELMYQEGLARSPGLLATDLDGSAAPGQVLLAGAGNTPLERAYVAKYELATPGDEVKGATNRP